MSDLKELKEKLKKFRIECLLKGKERHIPSGHDYEVGWRSHDVYNPTIYALLKAIEDMEEDSEEEEEIEEE